MPDVGVDPRSEEFSEAFGNFLLDRRVLDELAVRRAQRAQRQSGERFDLVLTRLGLVSEAAIAEALGNFLGIDVVAAPEFPEYPLLPDRLQLGFLKTNRLLPVAELPDRLIVAVADPFNNEAVAGLSFLLERPIERCIATAGDIDRAIERLYAGTAAGRGAGSVAVSVSEEASEDDVRRLEDMASEAPVIRLVHDLIVRAVDTQASDIHIEPREDSLRVRNRIDGVLHTVETLPLALKAAVTSRIKIMARLNIAERRLPQDGRIKAAVRGRDIDLRVSTMPTLMGESVVLRILDRSSVQLSFPALGFSPKGHEELQRLLDQPNGIILVTGPTGSGKTTTLYTALSALNSTERKIFTVEDPIEYQLVGINQIQVQPKIGLTFATALRSILRQDPDIIMVGEIRDLETAEIAIQASLTGHLVLSTVHTNSAAATITRLLDMGVEHFLLASSVTGVLAQRLVRRLCSACAVPAEASPTLIEKLAGAPGSQGAQRLDLSRLRKKVGCPACRHTGFAGRTTISELLVMSDAVRDGILTSGTERAIEAAALEGGMVTMFRDGVGKVLAGETTIEEVLRATRMG